MIDTNEVGALISSCKNAAYLHHLLQLISARLNDLGGTATVVVCTMCSGKKKLFRRTKDGYVEQKCPKCQPDDPAPIPVGVPVELDFAI